MLTHILALIFSTWCFAVTLFAIAPNDLPGWVIFAIGATSIMLGQIWLITVRNWG